MSSGNSRNLHIQDDYDTVKNNDTKNETSILNPSKSIIILIYEYYFI